MSILKKVRLSVHDPLNAAPETKSLHNPGVDHYSLYTTSHTPKAYRSCWLLLSDKTMVALFYLASSRIAEQAHAGAAISWACSALTEIAGTAVQLPFFLSSFPALLVRPPLPSKRELPDATCSGQLLPSPMNQWIHLPRDPSYRVRRPSTCSLPLNLDPHSSLPLRISIFHVSFMAKPAHSVLGEEGTFFEHVYYVHRYQ